MHCTRNGGSRSRRAGFSMVELLATLAVAGVLITAGGPSFLAMVRDTRISTRVNLLLTDLHLARTAAITRNRDVVLCRSRNGRQCSPSADSHADWSIGWIVYVNRDQDRERDSGEPLLRVRAALPEPMSLSFNQWWRLSYHPDGSAKNGSFTWCDARGAAHARSLILFYSGRPRISVRSADGSPLDCG